MLDLMSFANILSQITGNKNSSGIMDGPGTGGITGTSPNMPNGPIGQQEPDVMQQILKLFQPNEQQFNKLSDTVGQMPQRSQYKPGLMDKISAYAAGLGTGAGPAGHYGGVPVGFQGDIPGGIKLQKSMLDDKYNQALSDWQNKVEPLGKLAQIEGQRNTNDRLIGGQVLSNERNNRRMTETERKDRETATINQQKADTSAARAKAYIDAKQFGMDHPKYEKSIDKDGFLVYTDPTNPTAPPIKTNVDTGKLNDMEKIDLQLAGRMKEIGAQGANQLRNTAAQGQNQQNLEGAKQGNRLSLEDVKSQNRTNEIGLRGEQARETKVTPSGNTRAGAATSATQQNQANINKIKSIINTDPSLKKYFAHNKQDQPTGEMVGTKMWKLGTDQAGYEKAKKLYESGSISKPSKLTDPSGKVYDTSTWSDKDISEATKRGWK